MFPIDLALIPTVFLSNFPITNDASILLNNSSVSAIFARSSLLYLNVDLAQEIAIFLYILTFVITYCRAI